MKTYLEMKRELEEKERQLVLIEEKIRKGEIAGNGVPQLLQDLKEEIQKLKRALKVD